jgi:hypothetical protein
VSAPPSLDLESAIAGAVAAVDVEAVRSAFRRQNEFVFLERWLPPAVVEPCLADVARVRPRVHRNYIPRHKKGGSVSAFDLAREAPAISALYHSPALQGFLRAVTGRLLLECPPGDPHAYALYFYTEPGDHIGFHYDTSYYRGARYTVLVGLIERSSSRLVCDPYRRAPFRLATEPGTLVLFNGDRLWHAVTPLGPGEERVSLTLEYVTDPGMSPLRRFVSHMKDSIAYFGFRSVFGRRRSSASPALLPGASTPDAGAYRRDTAAGRPST